MQFLLTGAGLFWLNSIVEPAGPTVDPATIVVKEEYVETMANQLAELNLRETSAEDLELIKQQTITQEVLYREALNRELARGDEIIRRHLIQKMHFLLDSKSTPEAPTEEELESWWRSNPEKYQTTETLSFEHIYLLPNSGKKSEVQRLYTEGSLVSDKSWKNGDSFIRGYQFNKISRQEIDGMFGSGFAENLVSANKHKWIGPVKSVYGEHFLLLKSVNPPRTQHLSEIRPLVYKDLMEEKMLAEKQKLINDLASRYRIVYQSQRTLAVN